MTLAWNWPGSRVALVTVAVRVWVAPGPKDPDTGETLSQAASSDAIQFNVPPPVLATVKVWGDGFVAWAAVKESCPGARPMVGPTHCSWTVGT
jgi:hypothetical protein